MRSHTFLIVLLVPIATGIQILNVEVESTNSAVFAEGRLTTVS